MLSVTVLLVVTAFICTVLSAAGKCPLYVAVLLLVFLHLLTALPR